MYKRKLDNPGGLQQNLGSYSKPKEKITQNQTLVVCQVLIFTVSKCTQLFHPETLTGMVNIGATEEGDELRTVSFSIFYTFCVVIFSLYTPTLCF